jgi:hypothetical protein
MMKVDAPSFRSIDGLIAVILFSLVVLPSCSRSSFPGEQEEVPTDVNDVPIEVRAAADRYCKRLGGARCEQWYWDREDHVWECKLHGLSRAAEIDIEPDGGFSELELVYDFTEVEKILPDMGRTIREKCRGDKGVFIELSLRREAFLDDIPELEDAWKMSGVVLEFQCPNGWDFEMDAKGMTISKKVDDLKDPANDTSPVPSK